MPLGNNSFGGTKNRNKKSGTRTGSYVVDLPAYNTIDPVKTTVTTSATLLDFPDTSDKFVLVHRQVDSVLYIGQTSAITADGARTFPIKANEFFPLNGIIKGDTNFFYGISANASITVYIVGLDRI